MQSNYAKTKYVGQATVLIEERNDHSLIKSGIDEY